MIRANRARQHFQHPRTTWLTLAAAVAVAVAIAPSTAAARQDPGTELLTAEQQLANALVAKDAAAFEGLLAPEFVLRGAPDIARADWIANALRLCWGDRAEIGEFRLAQSSGDRAIATLMVTTSRDPETCERATVRSLITDLWEQRGGRWQLVLRHAGPAGGVAAQFAKTAAPPAIWEASAELSLVDTGGNADTQTLGTAGTLTWRPGRWTTEARTSFVRSVSASIETARTFLIAVRESRPISPRVDAFGRGEYFINEFAGIDNRISVDGGLGFRVVPGPVHTLRIDAGVGYAREDRLSGDDLSFALSTLGAGYKWVATRILTLENAALFTASLQDADDWRFKNALAITSRLNHRVSLKLSHELNFARTPAPGFGRTDTVLSAALVLGF